MATLIIDQSKIDRKYSKNTLYTNTIHLQCSINVERDLTKVYNKTIDPFGSSKNSVHYIIKENASKDFEKYCRVLSKTLRDLLYAYEIHMMTKRCEVWKEKDYEENIEMINTFRFVISIDHISKKVWVKIIFSRISDNTHIDFPDSEGNTKRTGDEDLIEVIGDNKIDEVAVVKHRQRRPKLVITEELGKEELTE